MAEQPSSVLAMLTEFFAGEQIEATARRTGFVQRASIMASATPFFFCTTQKHLTVKSV